MKKSMTGHHAVLLTEAVDHLMTDFAGVYVDATFGRGGHAREILKKLHAQGKLIALDRDNDAVASAQAPEFAQDPRFCIIHTAFSNLLALMREHDLVGSVNGILLDLGVSSPQLDEAHRGFSFLRQGPLDMRMDISQGMTAALWLSTVKESALKEVLTVYGEERYAGRIARAIVTARVNMPIATTDQLADIIADAVPRVEKHKHPATRVFQAIRIFINKEFDELNACLLQSLEVLRVGGRIAVISFHSLEDRIVKHFFQKHAKGDEPPRGIALRESEIQRNIRLKLMGKAIKPSEHEVRSNPRSRSAVLRIAEKVA